MWWIANPQTVVQLHLTPPNNLGEGKQADPPGLEPGVSRFESYHLDQTLGECMYWYVLTMFVLHLIGMGTAISKGKGWELIIGIPFAGWGGYLLVTA